MYLNALTNDELRVRRKTLLSESGMDWDTLATAYHGNHDRADYWKISQYYHEIQVIDVMLMQRAILSPEVDTRKPVE